MQDTSPMESKQQDEKMDPAVEGGLERLTQEKIVKGINQVLHEESGARLKVYVQTCMRCGLCSDACSYFLSNDKNPRFSPAAKVKQTIWEMLKKKRECLKRFFAPDRTHCPSGMQCLPKMLHVLPLWN